VLQFKKSSKYEVAFIQPGDEIFGIADRWPDFPPSVRLKPSVNIALVLVRKHIVIQRTDKCDKRDEYVYSGES
jgi:hypothetical protein